jgi:DNA-directed RNA polymerase subunit RPC12/RpoP
VPSLTNLVWDTFTVVVLAIMVLIVAWSLWWIMRGSTELRVRCPRCGVLARTGLVVLVVKGLEVKDGTTQCPACGHEITYGSPQLLDEAGRQWRYP